MKYFFNEILINICNELKYMFEIHFNYFFTQLIFRKNLASFETIKNIYIYISIYLFQKSIFSPTMR